MDRRRFEKRERQLRANPGDERVRRHRRFSLEEKQEERKMQITLRVVKILRLSSRLSLSLSLLSSRVSRKLQNIPQVVSSLDRPRDYFGETYSADPIKDIRASVFMRSVTLTKMKPALRRRHVCRATREIRALSDNLRTDHSKKYDPLSTTKRHRGGLGTIPCKFTISVAYEPRKRTT